MRQSSPFNPGTGVGAVSVFAVKNTYHAAARTEETGVKAAM
jgi:hypothetical protein